MQFILRASPRACARIHVMWRTRYTECICAAEICMCIQATKETGPTRSHFVYTGDKLHVAQTARDEWGPAEIQKSW